jgi:DNA-binding NarL/FixJ family response regulator
VIPGEGLAAFVEALPDVVLIDAEGERSTALDLLGRIREISDVPVVVVGPQAADPADDERVLALGADAVLATDAAAESVAAVVVGLGARRAHVTRVPVRLTADRARSIAREALRAELERQLVECRGNLAEVGRRMGKDRSTIRYHLRRFGMLGEPNGSREARRAVDDDASGRHRPGDRSRESEPQSSPISRLNA